MLRTMSEMLLGIGNRRWRLELIECLHLPGLIVNIRRIKQKGLIYPAVLPDKRLHLLALAYYENETVFWKPFSSPLIYLCISLLIHLRTYEYIFINIILLRPFLTLVRAEDGTLH